MCLTLETKVWEGDWELILLTNRLQKLQERCNFNFTRKTLLINNVKNIDLVKKAGDKLINKEVIDEYIVANDYIDEVLSFFKISKESLGKGYYYSISELVSIYLCKTEQLLHLSGDSLPDKNLPSNWIQTLLQALNSKPEIKVANLLWNRKYKEAKRESFYEDINFFYGHGFSDQMFLINVNDFRKPILSEKNIASERYPEYGGELFEKRIDSWMRNNNFIRATYKNGSYIHKNFPKNKLLRKTSLLSQKNFKY